MLGIEPSPCLVDGFGDEIGWELILEQILVLEGVMPLGDRHSAGVEPGINDFGNPAHFSLTLLALKRDHVYLGAVKVEACQVEAGPLLQFCDAVDAGLIVARLTFPYWQGGSPVTLAPQCPVYVVRQPVAEASVLDVFRIPVDQLVIGQQALFSSRCAYIPGGLGIVEQGRIAPPAKRVGMLVLTDVV